MPGLMRQSLHGSWDICPLRAWWSRQDMPYATSEEAAKGTAYHRALALFYEAARNGHPLPSAVPGLLIEASLAFEDEIERAEDRFRWTTDKGTALDSVKHMLQSYDWGYWLKDHKVRHVEVTFNQEHSIPGWRAGGTIDLVLEDPFGHLMLVDHKTTGRKWSQGKSTMAKLPQAAWYIWAIVRQEMLDYYPGFTFDVMTTKGELEHRAIEYDVLKLNRTLSRFDLVMRAMDTLDAAGIIWPPNPSSVLCSAQYCNYWDRCPYGGDGDDDDS